MQASDTMTFPTWGPATTLQCLAPLGQATANDAFGTPKAASDHSHSGAIPVTSHARPPHDDLLPRLARLAYARIIPNIYRRRTKRSGCEVLACA